MNILSVADYGDNVQHLLELTSKLRQYPSLSLPGKLIATYFLEPSTRTKSSFQAAIKRLGGDFIDVLPEHCSQQKGESLQDTLVTLSQYCDVIVLRTKDSLDLRDWHGCPIINAGDGIGEHPTQALLDAYTLYQHFADKEFSILITGDIRVSRVVNSLVLMLHKHFPLCSIYFYGTNDIQIRNQDKHITTFDELIFTSRTIDVLYMTRMQYERGTVGKPELVLTSHYLSYVLNPQAVIMHPLPRLTEIPPDVDRDARAIYFREQVPNGVYARMALLYWLLIEKAGCA